MKHTTNLPFKSFEWQDIVLKNQVNKYANKAFEEVTMNF
jgi:hypothetical protein